MPDLVRRCACCPHRVMILSDDASASFQSYNCMYNVKVKQARDSNDSDSGAEWGIAPWKLGMLAASLFLWDILWGTHIPHFQEQQWVVEAKHIE
eukprot:4190943-Heterocapsa_arctica.AAC.1